MPKKTQIRLLLLPFLSALLTLAGLFSPVYTPPALAGSPTPAAKSTALALQSSPSNTDGIAFLGIIILVVILAATAFHIQYLHSDEH